MRIFRGLVLLTMIVVATAYWVNSRPKQEIDFSAAVMANPTPEKPVAAKGFTLLDAKGRPVQLADLKGKPVLLHFWATWCPPCVEELPMLLRLAEWGSKELGLVTLAISSDEDWKTINAFFAEKKLWSGRELPLTILLNVGGSVAQEYGSSRLPETFFIDRDQKIIRRFVGAQNWTDQEIVKWIAEHSK